ncbi:unnamed protein product [Sphagnum balticum]
MSAVINMQQRRTRAHGRQNRDPNTAVGEKEEHTPKKACPKIEKSIQEVLNHTRNTSGRGRQMVLAALQQQKAETKPSQTAFKTSPSAKELQAMTKASGQVADRSNQKASRPSVMQGRSGSSPKDTRKRSMDSVDHREPLSVRSVPASNREGMELDEGRIVSPSQTVQQKEQTIVYTKRPKLQDAPPEADSLSSDLTDKKDLSPSDCFVEQSKSTTDIFSQTSNRRQLKTSPPPDACRENSLAVSSMTASELLVPLSNSLVNIGTPEREAVRPLVIASPPRLHGLMNLGNTCYMNVVVQALFSLPTFVSAMMRLSNRFSEQEAADANDLELRSPSRNESVYSALLHVLQELNGADRHVPVNPVVLKRSFAKHQARFWGSVQQDAHEFFCSLIDHIQEEVSSLLKKQSVNRADCPELGSICPTTYSFSCTVRNSLTCVDCGKVSHVEEMYRDFSIALPEDERDNCTKAYDLESLLHLYFQETTMSRKCEKCEGATVKAQVQILQLPRVLVLQLKRLHMDRDIPCTKVSAPVNFSSQLDIGPWCAKDVHNPKSAANGFVSDEQPMAVNCESQAHPVWELNGMLAQPSSSVQESPDYVKGDMNIQEATIEDSSQMILDVANERTKVVSTSYRLQGIVQHLGGQASGGHFIADIHDAKANRWFRCDDSIVRDEPAEIVFSKVKEAYMFFYVNESLSGDNSSSSFEHPVLR